MALDNLARELDHAAARENDEEAMGRVLWRALGWLLLIAGLMVGAAGYIGTRAL